MLAESKRKDTTPCYTLDLAGQRLRLRCFFPSNFEAPWTGIIGWLPAALSALDISLNSIHDLSTLAHCANLVALDFSDNFVTVR